MLIRKFGHICEAQIFKSCAERSRSMANLERKVKNPFMNQLLKLAKGNYTGNIKNFKQHAGFITNLTTYNENYKTDFHYHENPHLSLIVEGGNFEHKKNQSSVKIFGNVSFYHSGEIHKTIPTVEMTKNLNLEIESVFIKENFLSENTFKNAVEKNSDSRLLMLKIYSELQLNDNLTETSIQVLLLNFNEDLNILKYKSNKWCIDLKDILNDEWDEKHNLSDLSQRLGVHPVTISKYFRKYFGCTYGDYVRKIKIDKSLNLIKHSNQSLTEIAFLCGFADQSHFIRVFKLYTGINPKAFQKL